MNRPAHSQRASVVLVALCFSAVIGISLATYLAVCSRAMALSNRSYQTGLSTNLAEAGLEQALSAYANNSWTGWTLSGVTATRTLSPSGLTGGTASIKISVTNTTATTWRSSSSYAVGSIAWHRGKWYQCKSATGPTLVQPPDDTTSWVSVPMAWSAETAYRIGDVVVHSGSYYRCLAAHISRTPPDTSVWQSASASNWSAATAYAVNDLALYGGTVWLCLQAHSNQLPPNTSYWASVPVIFTEGRFAVTGSPTVTSQLKAELAPASLFPNVIGASNTSTSISLASSGTVESYNSNALQHRPWSSTDSYAPGETVYYAADGRYYRCITSHSNQVPANNTSYWTPALAAYPAWNSSVSYQVGDLVVESGVVYRCKNVHVNQAPPSGLWEVQDIGHPAWVSGTNYSLGDIVFYQPPSIAGRSSAGMLYRLRASMPSPYTNAPTDTTYWEGGTANYATWTATGYRKGDLVFYQPTGLLYRCATTHTSSQVPIVSSATNTSYWRLADTRFASWSSTASYRVGDLVLYSDTVYRCIVANANQTPPNATYWNTSTMGYSAVVAAPAVTSSSTATIRGYVSAAASSFSTNAVVQGPTSLATPKVDPARVTSNYYVPRFDLPASYAALSGSGGNLPANAGNGTILYEGARCLGRPGDTTPTVYNITGTYISGSTTSYTSGLYLDETTDVLTIVGPVVLNVSGILYTSGGRIVVGPTGSLEIYFNGSQLFIGNNTAGTGGGILNQTFDPSKMLIVSASTYNSSSYHYYWSRHPLYGLIYMPDAYLHKWNSGYDGEIYGAVSSKTAYFNHAATLDYDVSLRTYGGVGRYLDQPLNLSTWRQLTDPAERITLP